MESTHTVARLFRLYEKKRGKRRTGPSWIGRLGEFVFFGSLFLLGLIALANTIYAEIVHPTGAPTNIGLGFWLTISVLGSFILIGGAGILWSVFHSGTSIERRSALAKKADNIDLVSQAIPMPREYPALPTDANLTNSPGVVFAYRLPTVESPAWGLFAAAVFCLAWNGVVAFLTVWATRTWVAGEPEWLLTMLLIPGYCVGGWSIAYFLRHLVLHTGIGPTIVEISNHPLYPGGRYEMLLSQTGQLRVKSLQVHLVCEEDATYHQGTDIRHERRSVYRHEILSQTAFRIEPGGAWEKTLEFQVPAEAMHSFQSAHNAVAWKIVVDGEFEEWPPFQRSFPVIVYPLRQQVSTAESIGTIQRRPAFAPPHEPRLRQEVIA